MSKYAQGVGAPIQTQQKNLTLNIKDTDFLLNLINKSSVDGPNITQAASTQEKLRLIHSKLTGVGANV